MSKFGIDEIATKMDTSRGQSFHPRQAYRLSSHLIKPHRVRDVTGFLTNNYVIASEEIPFKHIVMVLKRKYLGYIKKFQKVKGI